MDTDELVARIEILEHAVSTLLAFAIRTDDLIAGRFLAAIETLAKNEESAAQRTSDPAAIFEITNSAEFIRHHASGLLPKHESPQSLSL